MWSEGSSCVQEGARSLGRSLYAHEATLDRMAFQDLHAASQKNLPPQGLYQRIRQHLWPYGHKHQAYQVSKVFQQTLTDHLLHLANAIEESQSKALQAQSYQTKSLYNRLYDVLQLSQAARRESKRHPLRPSMSSSAHTHYILHHRGHNYGVFKPLTPKEMAGEIGACFIGALSKLNFSRPAIPISCYVRNQHRKELAQGIFTAYEHHVESAAQLLEKRGPKEGRALLEGIKKETLDALCIFHLLRGSRDAHLGNTLLHLKNKSGPRSAQESLVELEVHQVHEIDNEAIMAPANRYNEEFQQIGDIAPLRIWWLGLEQAARPFSKAALLHLLSLKVEDFRCLNEQLRIFSKERVNGLITRLTTMQQLARKELQKKAIALTPRELFSHLSYQHPTIELCLKLYPDPLDAYEQIGAKPKEELHKEALRLLATA